MHQLAEALKLRLGEKSTQHIASAILSIVIIAALNYIFALSRYHRGHTFHRDVKAQLPPHYPFVLPHFEPLIRIWLDHKGFLRRISSYNGKLTANRIYLMGHTLYTFQDRETISKLFKHPSLSSSINMYSYVNSYLLGTPKSAMGVYQSDNSGPFPQPHPMSNVPSHNRIDFITHHSVFRGLTGPGLQPNLTRFTHNLQEKLADYNITDDWTDMADFKQFFRDIVGASMLQSVLGPTLIRLNPGFVNDIFKFDSMFPTFAPGLPRFMMPESHRFRDGLVSQFKNWYKYARDHFDESNIHADGDGDPYWGSHMMRSRQQTILGVDGLDEEALARVDLGLAWAIIGNVVPSSMFSAFHIFKDKELLSRVRSEIQEQVGQSSLGTIDAQKFSKSAPLLSSIYAETLRVYIKVYSVYSSPHEDVDLGRWVLPKGELAVLNSAPSHMDETFWNSRNGRYPVQSFWADRFLVDPTDPDSGPVLPECRKSSVPSVNAGNSKPYFSTDGCEGAWLPYGGGYSMCPGRFLAKTIIIYTAALLANEYDVELVKEGIEFTTKRYGMGVEDIKNPIPFRIRKRAIERQ